MAQIPNNDYGARVDSTDPDYPQGKAQNLIGAVVGTGTPTDAGWVNDDWGFKQEILDQAGITPSGFPDKVGASQYLEGLNRLHILNSPTLAHAIARTDVKSGMSIDIEERNASNGGGATWDVVLLSSVTVSVGEPAIGNIVTSTGDGTLALVLREDKGVADIKRWGAIGDDSTDDEPAITLALNSGAPVIYFPKSASKYKIVAGLEPPNKVLLFGAGENVSRIKYYGTGTAISFGESSGTLNTGCGGARFKVELVEKTSKAINLRATEKANLEFITLEGLYQPFDNTRTNIGIHIDGADASSFFNMFNTVKCNHMHVSYRIQTTGSVHATTQYFLNCTAFGDQATDDSSFGYRIGDGGTHNQEGQGTVISGGNVELCNTAFLVGNRAGSVTVDGVRIEINTTGTAWKFDFVDGCDPWTIKGVNGLGLSYMEANSGIRNFDSNSHVLLTDDNGSLRLGGFDGPLNATQFIGIGGSAPEFRHNANSQLLILSMGDDTDTGRTLIQQGSGSAAHGGHVDLSGAAHASRAGDCTMGPAANTGSWKVNRGLNGATHLEVDRNSTADETTLLLFDITAGTLVRVSRGAVDSESAGFRNLRIPN